MLTTSELSGFRGGVLYAAAHISPTTARTWPVQIGVKEGVGHKRYSVFDVAALRIMSVLTSENGFAASIAAKAVNAMRNELAIQILDYHAGLEQTNEWPDDKDGTYALIEGHAGDPSVEYFDIFGLAKRLHDLPPAACIVLSLRRISRQSLYNLERVLTGDLPQVAED